MNNLIAVPKPENFFRAVMPLYFIQIIGSVIGQPGSHQLSVGAAAPDGSTDLEISLNPDNS